MRIFILSIMCALMYIASTAYQQAVAGGYNGKHCFKCTINNYYESDVPGPQGPQGEPGIAGADGLDGKNYLGDDISDDDIQEVFAGATAMAGIDFDSTTKKLQLGISLSGFGSANNVGIGVGQVLEFGQKQDLLFSFKTLVDEVEIDGDSERPWVAAAVWKVNLE